MLLFMHVCYRMFTLEMDKVERELQRLSGVTSWAIPVQCGPLNCSFELKLYRFRDYSIGHELYSPPTTEDDVFEYDNAYQQ